MKWTVLIVVGMALILAGLLAMVLWVAAVGFAFWLAGIVREGRRIG